MKSGLFGIAMAVACAQGAYAQERQPKAAPSQFDGIIAKHAAATGVPEALIRRVIVRESKYNPRALNRGNYGMMQIKPATARSMGYQGGPAGLLDADTNLTYAVRYLAGAYRVAGGNHDRAVRLYASGYYYDAKRRGMLAAVGLGRGAKPFTNVASATPAAAAPAPTAAPVKVETRVAAPVAQPQPVATRQSPAPRVAAASPRVISPNAAPALASSLPGAAKPTAPASRVATAAAAGGLEPRTVSSELVTPDPKAVAYAGPRQPAPSPFKGVAAPRAATVPTPPLPPVARVSTPAAPALGLRGPVAPTTPVVAAVPTPPARDPMVATGSVAPSKPTRSARAR